MNEDMKTYQECFRKMFEICWKNNWGDPFSYARSREILIAGLLGHKVAETYSGADGIQDEDIEVEYKSTIGSKLSASYSGISKKATWEEQVEYITNEKIGKYKYHYHARFEGPDIVEVWRLNGEELVPIILQKIENQFYSTKVKADPRLACTISEKLIKKMGTEVCLT